jgi:hypothetical protein
VSHVRPAGVRVLGCTPLCVYVTVSENDIRNVVIQYKTLNRHRLVG